MLICLDFDGVLVDSFDDLLAMMIDVQAELGRGRVPAAEDFRFIEHLTFEGVARRIGLAGDDVERFIAGMLARQTRTRDVRVFPGIVEALEGLSREHVIVVVTANHADIVLETLPRLGLDASVTAVYGSERGESKARRIEVARRHHGFARREVVMVGDAVSDMQAGRAAGVLVAAVAWGYQPRQWLATAAPDLWLELPHELVAMPARLAACAESS